MMKQHLRNWLLCGIALASGGLCAQGLSSSAPQAELRLRIVLSQPGKQRPVPAVIWLESLAGTPAPPFMPHGRYTLLQKDRTFIPHLQVIPVGTVVQFPNVDPFFHNVFSLFDGKRFDLGLYEAGATNSVRFDHVGVSYLFCNIHPEMSAVVVAVDTPYYGIPDKAGNVAIANVPDGRYEMHVWFERSTPEALKGLARSVRIETESRDLGTVTVLQDPSFTPTHKNKYGQDYAPPPKQGYSQP